MANDANWFLYLCLHNTQFVAEIAHIENNGQDLKATTIPDSAQSMRTELRTAVYAISPIQGFSLAVLEGNRPL
jgi:hypothetical protein